MKTNQFFTQEELNEIETLQIRGGSGISPLANSNCVNNHCVFDLCTIQSLCSGLNNQCVNNYCIDPGVIVKPQSGCPVLLYVAPICKK